jgi:hypothetical protein
MPSGTTTVQPWAVSPEKVSEVVARLVAAASPFRLIAQRCAQACGDGSTAQSDLAAAEDLDLLVVELEVAAATARPSGSSRRSGVS